MRSARFIRVAAPFLAGSLLLAACGSESEDGDEGTGGSDGGTKTAKIGVIAPLSGDLSALGLGIKNAVDLAIRQANEDNTVDGWKFELAVADDPVTFSSAASAFRSVPNTLDPPEHGRFRAVVDRFFTPERMRTIEPRLRSIAHDIVSGLPRGAPVDAVTRIGYPFAVRAQADWLGWRGVEDQFLRV